LASITGWILGNPESALPESPAWGHKAGGSTITQQLAKNYFLTPERSISRKFKEVLMALTIGMDIRKDEILDLSE
jgi:penicillin-binding protein 1A